MGRLSLLLCLDSSGSKDNTLRACLGWICIPLLLPPPLCLGGRETIILCVTCLNEIKAALLSEHHVQELCGDLRLQRYSRFGSVKALDQSWAESAVSCLRNRIAGTTLKRKRMSTLCASFLERLVILLDIGHPFRCGV